MPLQRQYRNLMIIIKLKRKTKNSSKINTSKVEYVLILTAGLKNSTSVKNVLILFQRMAGHQTYKIHDFGSMDSGSLKLRLAGHLWEEHGAASASRWD